MQTFDEERFSINTAWMRKGGEHFEVVIDPHEAIEYRHHKGGDLNAVLKAKHVFTNAKKGDRAGEHLLQQVFHTTDELAVARTLLLEGELQLTKEQRDEMREAKHKKLVMIISRNAVDPKNGLPHPMARIELAFEEAKIKVDEYKRPEDQVQDVVRKLQPILPIRFENTTLNIRLEAAHAAKCYGIVQGYGTIKRQEWQNDGSWTGDVEMPAGLAPELIDELGSKTHGAAQITKL